MTRRQGSWFRDEYGFLHEWIVLLSGAVVLAFVVMLLTVVIVSADWHAQHIACRQLHEQTGYESRMVGGPLAGECYVQVDERWVPASRYRMVEVGK